MLAPICLFTYNRLESTQQTIEALKQNYLAKESVLIIFSDGAKNEENKAQVQSVRDYLHTIDGFQSVEIIESPVNKGLANSIISGVSQVIEQYGKVIVLEDDIITLPNFLDFMNEALDYYFDNQDIQSINAFSVYLKNNIGDYFFQTRPFPWGWATWKDRWYIDIFNKDLIYKNIKQNENMLSRFNNECGADAKRMLLNSLSNKNNSWYIRWTFYHFLNNKLSLYPKYSLVYNIGFGKEGTHCKSINPYFYRLEKFEKRIFNFDDNVNISNKLKKDFLVYFSKTYRLKIRIQLLKSMSGINLLYQDIKMRLK